MKNFDLHYFNLHPILKNSLLTSGILLVTSIFCFLLQQFVTADAYVPLIFILAIVLISRFSASTVFLLSPISALISH